MEKDLYARRKAFGLLLAAVVIAASLLIPPFEGLDRTGINALGILLAAVVMWVTDALPAGVTGLLSLVLMIAFGISTPADAFLGIGSNSVVFTISVFSLTIILTKSSLARRIIGSMIKWAKADSKKLVLAFMLASAVLSSVMSNLAVGAMFMGIAFTIFEAVGAQKLKSNFARCIMLGIPVGAVNGGMGTPAGSSLNIVALGLYEEVAGKTITFLQWTIIGFPFMLVMTFVCWFCIVKVLKP